MSAVVETKNLKKVYGSVVALDSFTHTFDKGRVHALMGKNGSGKSTLVNVMAGVVEPTEGDLLLNDKSVSFRSPADALRANVVTVHQELSLVPELTVTENIFLGRMPKKSAFGLPVIDWRGADKATAALLEDMGLDIAPNTPVSQLSVGQQQTVEIAKAMSFDPSLLLLDEPTSALATKEVEMLFGLLRRLRERGVTMMYISHRMSELAEIADTVTVLRDGQHIGSVEMQDTTNQEIVDMMFGSVANDRPARRAKKLDTTSPILEVKNLTRANAFRDVSFKLYKGEVLGIAGMLGAGRSEVLRAIFGADKFDSGEIYVEGQRIL